MQKYPFSLLELIIVIAIIVILLVLILPGLTKLKALSSGAVCTNNLKQIGTAGFIYQQDHNDFTMPAKFSSKNNFNHWANYVFETIPSETIFICPALPDQAYFNPSGGLGHIQKAAYVMNIIENSAIAWSGSQIDSAPQMSHGWGTLDNPLHSSRINTPESSIYILDVIANIHFNHSGINTFRRTDHGSVTYPPTGQVRWVGFYHQSAFNLLYGDMHVQQRLSSEDNNWVVHID